MDSEAFKKSRQVTLANAASLLRAAEKLEGCDVEHVRYHLSALALEEIGKVVLLGMRVVAGMSERRTPAALENQLDDHVQKLFWAIWGPSFGRIKLTREQLEQHRGLARRIHNKRLFSLYSDPEVPLLPSEKITREEADNVFGMAQMRLDRENADETASLEINDDLRWFLGACDDAEKRAQIFGSKSLDKLTELGGVRDWVKWLRQVFAEHDVQMQALFQKEISRTPSADRSSAKPKWRIKFRIYSHSHSIRQKPLNAWNERTDFISLSATNKRKFSQTKKDEIIATINLDSSVSAGALWHFGWGIARSVVAALNIGTRGFFWWYVPSDTAGWYEEIWDVENNAGVRVTEGPRLEMPWGNLVLTDTDMTHTAIVFGYIAGCRGTSREAPLNSYITGLTFLSKLDFHWRCELNAFEQFWCCFEEFLKVTKHWDGQSDIKEAASQALSDLLSETNELHAYLERGLQFDAAASKQTEFPRITLTEVIGMKLYCDLLLLKSAVESLKQERMSNRVGKSAES
jgi:AbiV family abortive infection protein